MGRQTKIPAKLFEAVRDGKMRQAEGARQAGVTRQAFEQAFLTFKIQQLRQQSGWELLARVEKNDQLRKQKR
jgi:hypothetical protein